MNDDDEESARRSRGDPRGDRGGRARAGRARPRGRARASSSRRPSQGALRRRRDAECAPPAGRGEGRRARLCRDRLRPRHAGDQGPSRPRARRGVATSCAPTRPRPTSSPGSRRPRASSTRCSPRNGITRIASKGLPLDPNQHQAMIEIPSDEAEPGTVVEEMQAGYMIKDRLLRPALVGVAKKPGLDALRGLWVSRLGGEAEARLGLRPSPSSRAGGEAADFGAVLEAVARPAADQQHVGHAAGGGRSGNRRSSCSHIGRPRAWSAARRAAAGSGGRGRR